MVEAIKDKAKAMIRVMVKAIKAMVKVLKAVVKGVKAIKVIRVKAIKIRS